MVDVPCLDHPWDAVLTMDKLSRKYQKSTTWHASGSLMTGIPCLEHPWILTQKYPPQHQLPP